MVKWTGTFAALYHGINQREIKCGVEKKERITILNLAIEKVDYYSFLAIKDISGN